MVLLFFFRSVIYNKHSRIRDIIGFQSSLDMKRLFESTFSRDKSWQRTAEQH